MRKEHAPKSPKKSNDIEFEIAFFENVLRGAPDFIEALTAIGDLYTKAGLWQKGLDVDVRLAQLRPDDPLVHYNLACSYALLNQNPASLSSLTKAIELGYDDFDYLKNDSDLENLFKDPDVVHYIREIEKGKKP